MIELREFQPGDEPVLRAVFDSAIHGTARRDYSQLQVDTWAPREFDADAWGARMRGIAPFFAHFGFEVLEHRVFEVRGVEMRNALLRRRLR